MFKIIASFFLLGLSFGIGPCLVSCGPLLISYLVGTNKKVIPGIWAYFLFSLSRILVYVVLGLVVFSCGELVVRYKLEFLSRYVFIFGGIFIIIIGLSVAILPLAHMCQVKRSLRDTNTIIGLGLITGLLPCAPLISVSSYIGLVSQTWTDSIVDSISFGLGTAVSPLFLLVLSGSVVSGVLINKDKIRRILNIICGLIIIFLGLRLISSQ